MARDDLSGQLPLVSVSTGTRAGVFRKLVGMYVKAALALLALTVIHNYAS